MANLLRCRANACFGGKLSQLQIGQNPETETFEQFCTNAGGVFFGETDIQSLTISLTDSLGASEKSDTLGANTLNLIVKDPYLKISQEQAIPALDKKNATAVSSNPLVANKESVSDPLIEENVLDEREQTQQPDPDTSQDGPEPDIIAHRGGVILVKLSYDLNGTIESTTYGFVHVSTSSRFGAGRFGTLTLMGQGATCLLNRVLHNTAYKNISALELLEQFIVEEKGLPLNINVAESHSSRDQREYFALSGESKAQAINRLLREHGLVLREDAETNQMFVYEVAKNNLRVFFLGKGLFEDWQIRVSAETSKNTSAQIGANANSSDGAFGTNTGFATSVGSSEFCDSAGQYRASDAAIQEMVAGAGEFDPAVIAALYNIESAWEPNVVNSFGYTGLWQCGADCESDLGTSLAGKSVREQTELLTGPWFSMWDVNPAEPGQYYQAVAYPACVQTPNSTDPLPSNVTAANPKWVDGTGSATCAGIRDALFAHACPDPRLNGPGEGSVEGEGNNQTVVDSEPTSNIVQAQSSRNGLVGGGEGDECAPLMTGTVQAGSSDCSNITIQDVSSGANACFFMEYRSGRSDASVLMPDGTIKTFSSAHVGVDGGPRDTDDIKAWTGGVVETAADLCGGAGLTVILNTSESVIIDGRTYPITSRYLHMSRIDVQVGQTVERGTVLGRIGGTSCGLAQVYDVHWHIEHYAVGTPYGKLHVHPELLFNGKCSGSISSSGVTGATGTNSPGRSGATNSNDKTKEITVRTSFRGVPKSLKLRPQDLLVIDNRRPAGLGWVADYYRDFVIQKVIYNWRGELRMTVEAARHKGAGILYRGTPLDEVFGPLGRWTNYTDYLVSSTDLEYTLISDTATANLQAANVGSTVTAEMNDNVLVASMTQVGAEDFDEAQTPEPGNTIEQDLFDNGNQAGLEERRRLRDSACNSGNEGLCSRERRNISILRAGMISRGLEPN